MFFLQHNHLAFVLDLAQHEANTGTESKNEKKEKEKTQLFSSGGLIFSTSNMMFIILQVKKRI
jgi:hypothetical protein